MAPNGQSVNIWFTGENQRPNLQQNWDAFLSFEVDNLDGRNFYLPLWVTRLAPTVEGAKAEIEKLMQSRSEPYSPRSLMACIVASNPEPLRMGFLELLKRNISIDAFGQIGSTTNNKNETISNYIFNLCFENDAYPGYVTEKPIEAWLSGCIPVWRGIDSAGYLNEKAIIDVTKIGFASAVQEIIKISKSPEMQKSFYSEPILKQKFDLDLLISELRNLLHKR